MSLNVLAIIAVTLSAFALLLNAIVLVKVLKPSPPPPPAPELEPVDEPPLSAPKPLWP
jgi:hypothetical protein